jgi:cell division protein FtsX
MANSVKKIGIVTLILLQVFFCVVKCTEDIIDDHDNEVSIHIYYLEIHNLRKIKKLGSNPNLV